MLRNRTYRANYIDSHILFLIQLKTSYEMEYYSTYTVTQSNELSDELFISNSCVFHQTPNFQTIYYSQWCVDIMSTSALSSDHLVSIFMSTLQCVKVVGIILSNPCVTVHPPWQILRPGLLYFIISVVLKERKIFSRGIRIWHAKQACYPLGHAGLVEFGSMDQCGGIRPSQPNLTPHMDATTAWINNS